MRRIIKFIRRQVFLRNFKADCGLNCNVEHGNFVYSENLQMGSNVHIGFGALWNAMGNILLENNIIIGPKSTIWSINHNYNSTRFLPYDGKEMLKSVVIESNVWIGANVIINPGVRVGEGSVIAMGSVITKNVEPLSIMGGNPAKLIGKRNDSIYNKITSSKDLNSYSYLYAKSFNGLKKEIVRVESPSND